ncbi:hypothetical protein FKM82_007155 [Ascaphus truei]
MDLIKTPCASLTVDRAEVCGIEVEKDEIRCLVRGEDEIRELRIASTVYRCMLRSWTPDALHSGNMSLTCTA